MKPAVVLPVKPGVSATRPTTGWERGWLGLGLKAFPVSKLLFARELLADGPRGIEFPELTRKGFIAGWELSGFLKGPELTLFEKMVICGLELGSEAFLG